VTDNSIQIVLAVCLVKDPWCEVEIPGGVLNRSAELVEDPSEMRESPELNYQHFRKAAYLRFLPRLYRRIAVGAGPEVPLCQRLDLGKLLKAVL
jgi:hypothetical protein